jgi:rubredoxin
VTERTIVLKFPDIDSMSDDEIAHLLYLRDGRWSQQTKAMLSKFGTTKLNLNRAWAGLWQSWACPCCGRSKTQIARVSSAGVLLCQVEMHHDHLGDWCERKFSEINPRTDDRLATAQIDACKHSVMQLVARFGATPICLDCNLVEGRAKASLGKDVFPDFSFSPQEIAQFITVGDNRVHELDVAKVRAIWEELRPDIEDRIDFASRMAKRFANGKNRTHFSGHPAPEFWIDSASILRRIMGDDAAAVSDSDLSGKLLARSTARDAVGRSAKPKLRRPGRAPTQLEFDIICQQNADQKHWGRFGDDWTCDCCGRSKRAICRMANSGKWTARIHVIRDWKFSEAGPDADDAARDFFIDDHAPAFICQDCRNVVAELQRRDDALNEDSVILGDLQGAIITIADNEKHEIDFGFLMDRACENRGLADAIASYRALESSALLYLERANYMMKRQRCSFQEARDHLVQDHANLLGRTIEEATAHIEWFLGRAQRFEVLRRLEMGRDPVEVSSRPQ